MNDIANSICQNYHLHMEQYFHQKQHDINFRYLC